MDERTRIARYFAPLAAAADGSFALTDDAALLTPPAGTSLVITTDSVIESIHVLANASPQQFATKLIRRNLSDLAAMGATPWCYTLNLHTPRSLEEHWFETFTATLAAEQQQFGLYLIGGDSTSADAAPIHITMTCFGLTDGTVLRRNGAQVGDDLYVSGTIGDAAFGLAMLQHHLPPDPFCIDRYHTPEPRLALGTALLGIATAALDISDGLLADINQLCTASAVGADIIRSAIPLSPAVHHHTQHSPELWNLVLSGGDDYELCFTAPPSARAQLQHQATRIGTITHAPGLTLIESDGTRTPAQATGHQHN